ncbi:hypothetical protein BCON_0060g00450 [Botryotinia convoluta]|uniref:Alpha/beta hydrolase fold-3 domain-containing protein n=1 Tax=Botryotinia convoluta TaxID=54673 RepID=A0A4Z1I8R3_9HELO|nr:hypothetical protein BCON_0060g00450 [Botryotinia convoluta]
MESNSFFTSFPGKHLWIFGAIGLNLIRFPFWLIYYVPSITRPSPKWTYTQALRIRIIKAFVKSVSITKSATIINLLPGAEGSRFLTVYPASSSRYQGVTITNSEIKPEIIGGTWYPHQPSSGKEAGDVVLHFHGGAYVVGDGRTQDAGFCAETLIANSSASFVFCPQYRLASSPGGRFPAALQDAITSFSYLAETMGIKAENIVVSGDSAGGNLAMALLRYLHDNPNAGLPNPGCAWLWSPWVDPVSTIIEGIFHASPHSRTDYLNEGFGIWGAKGLTPLEGTGVELSHPNISFVGNPFKSPTPLFFSAGECEVLFDDVVRVHNQFTEAGNKTELQIEEGAVHDIILIGNLLGFKEEARLAAKRAGEFWERNR